jgi:hypothetical protein
VNAAIYARKHRYRLHHRRDAPFASRGSPMRTQPWLRNGLTAPSKRGLSCSDCSMWKGRLPAGEVVARAPTSRASF